MSQPDEPTPLPKSEPVVIEMTELRRKMLALPNTSRRGHEHAWTAEEDALLLEFWRVKRKTAIAKLLNVAPSTATLRYEWLAAQEKAKKP